MRACVGGEPPTLDVHWTSSTFTRDIGMHMYETLFTFDSNFNVIPELAESYEASKDGLTHTIKLRKGVQFHNGKEMTAEDVEATLRRWAKISGTGKDLFGRVDTLSNPDKYTMVFKLKKPFGVFDSSLSLIQQAATIYPKEVVEQAGDGQIKQFIGTGPYKFVEQQKDRFTKLARFDGYVPHGDKPNGFGGKKFAYFDELRFIPVPDQTVRVAGVQSGDYDYADNINTDQYLVLKSSQQVKTLIVKPARMLAEFFNLKSPITSDVKLRQAAMAAIDAEAVLKAGWGTPEFYDLNPGLMWRGTPWESDAGKEFYNQKNPDRARQLLKESNYKGEPLRWLTTKEFPWLYQEVVVCSQAMKAVGINVDMQVMDWASLVSRRAKPDGWELYGGSPTFAPNPLLTPWDQLGTFPGWWASEKAVSLRDKQLESTDPKEQFAIWEQFQRNFYDEVPFLYFGNGNELLITGSKVQGVFRSATLAFWNAWFAR